MSLSRRSTRSLAAPLVGLLVACAGPQAEKGGLVPLDLSAQRIAKAHAPRRIALLVGIQRFDDDRWRPLRYPQADARALAGVLGDQATGNFDEIEVLPPNATREELRAALRRLAARDRDERDTVVVYLSSHGTLARDEKGELRRYLVTRETRVDRVAETGLSMDELNAGFEALRSRRKVLILAACHSGSGKSLLPDDLRTELKGTKAAFFVRPIEDVSRASVVLAASDWGETAREDERLGNDVYTHFLVEALKLGADRNGDGAVTVSEAHDYARRMTYEFTGGKQRPAAETSEVGADPIVLAGRVRRAGRPEVYSYPRRLDGFTVRVDGKPLAELPGGVALDAGEHRIQVAKGGAVPLLDAAVELDPGERLDVERLMVRAAGRMQFAPRAAMLGFLDRGSRDRILGTVAGYGAAMTVREWPAGGMDLRVDAVTSSGRSPLGIPGGPASVRYDALSAGVAIPWRARLDRLGGLELLGGPRLSALWIRRRFDAVDFPAAPQSFLTITPGLLLGLELPVSRRLSLGAELHLDWALVRIDGENRSSGLAEGLLGVGWRF
ncbi:MAG TPA: caspase family protein [Anaeromyxobacteraceae bacterium]|nr:caspase family protein [Anaeromyxobacteraceae bacterium]